MKVLHLPYGGQMTTLCAALKEVGIEATSCHYYRSTYHFRADLCLELQNVPRHQQESLKMEFFEQALRDYDVFHFHFGLTFFDGHRDLEILSREGKKVVMQHRGTDVRRLSVARRYNNPYVKVKDPEEGRIIANLEQLSRYIDHVIVSDHELWPYVHDFYRNVHIVRQAIDLERYQPHYPTPDVQVPLIVHAPSHPVVKGTKYVRKALKDLGRRRPLQYRIIRHVPHEEAIDIYQQADLFIDQMCIGSFGVISLEAMALGKPVVCYIRDGLMDSYPEGLPIINADPDTLLSALATLIEQPNALHDIGIQSRRYVEQHHDARKIARQLKKIYRDL